MDKKNPKSPTKPKPKVLKPGELPSTYRQDCKDIAAKLTEAGKSDPTSVWAPPPPSNIDGLRPHQFKPGGSGNPYGRHKKLTAAYDEALDMVVPDSMLKGRFTGLRGSGIKFADLIAYNTTLLAAFGRKASSAINAAKELADRTEGKAVTRVESSVNVIHSELSPDDRRARLLELGLKSGDILEAEWMTPAELGDGSDTEPDTDSAETI